MFGSALVYLGLIVVVLGLSSLVRPFRRLGIPTRSRAVRVVVAGLVPLSIGLGLPAPESRVVRATTRLDEFAPAWQFREVHTVVVAAPPDVVFEAIKRVRASDILLFRTLTWIRRGGRPLPAGILNAGEDEPLIDVAVRGGFVRLAEDSPRELVIGTVVAAPPGTRGALTPGVFLRPLPPGFALATMNFVVRPDGASRCVVTTETRVYASSASARRRFAAYWRLIYPGSALIRRMWLRAIEQRATGLM